MTRSFLFARSRLAFLTEGYWNSATEDKPWLFLIRDIGENPWLTAFRPRRSGEGAALGWLMNRICADFAAETLL
jgi:hypothetical protein